MNNFIWESKNRPELIKLKEDFNLGQIVIETRNEFTAQLHLKNWVNKALKLGNPSRDYSSLSAFDILNDAKKNKEFYCTQLAQVFIQTATALGWYSRKLGIDSDHSEDEKDTHHGICDIWSNNFKKWYVIDPMYNLHFIKNGIPQNSLEIRNEYLKNKAKDLLGVQGINEEFIKYDHDKFGFDTPSNYFWFFISKRNNYFEKPNIFDSKAYLWIDEFNQDKIWYKDNKPHDMYDNRFIKTSDKNLIFPEIK